jgi:hypothetical protein
MGHSIHGRVGGHVARLIKQDGLAFAGVLTAARVESALRRCEGAFRDRIFSPAVTRWAFLGQVLGADHSCGDAVARGVAWRAAAGLPPCSANTGSYCQARGRLPLGLLQRLLRGLGARLHAQGPDTWRWKGRVVKVVDGTTVSMPDTPANQAAFPQPRTQKPGLGFPIARRVVVFSLACGAALDLAAGPCKGKKSGENSLFRRLIRRLAPGDVVLADRGFSGYCDLALLRQRGVDVVVRKHHRRHTDLRRATRLGRGDHLVIWRKPAQPPDSMSRRMFDALPARMTLRQVTIHLRKKGHRTRTLTRVTSLLDPRTYTRADLAELYRRRWDAELDLRSLKITLRMDVLRCKTPDMIVKELWMHLLAYNAVRLLMAQAADAHEQSPARLSFAGSLQLLRTFHAAGLLTDPATLPTLLHAIAQRIAPYRPGRNEPRAVKRRPKPHPLLQLPRHQARKNVTR